MTVSNLESVQYYSALGGMPKEQLVNIIKDRDMALKSMRFDLENLRGNVKALKESYQEHCDKCKHNPFEDDKYSDCYSGA